MISPRRAYRKLLSRHGPQGWWPVGGHHPASRRPEGQARRAYGPLGAGYHPGDYRTPSPGAAVEVCLGAILTQNAAWTNASRALEGLRSAQALDLGRVLSMSKRRLERLIRPSGFYVQKALKLKAFAARARDKRVPLARWLGRSPLPGLREDLLSIKGVGPETADSMLLYAANRPAFVVDAYTRRIGSRLGWYPETEDYRKVQAFLTARLPRSVRVYNEFHALLVAQAKAHCRKEPRCEGCPLYDACRRPQGPICPGDRGKRNSARGRIK